ncbi:type I glutamate--ammonia ligase [Flammeovirgaceae bacterium SG7u.111]|nr:type I glutamate--ammonia ligase [Flammeovirgaceae bacterium SG7u.132]WPO35575.1 type I glutamate--ammonia ligase [Flammeovirgaceae bacterium SG7u.111]
MAENIKKPKDFFEFAKITGAKMVDMKFADLLGTWQHCTYPIETWSEDTFKEGIGFDGAAMRGWQHVGSTDLMAIPDPSTTQIDPFFKETTLSIIADIFDPQSKATYERDPRGIAKKAIAYLQQSGIADTCYVGPEPEFFVFDEVGYHQSANNSFYNIESTEGSWNKNRIEEPNLGYKPSYKGGFFPVSPTDGSQDLRNEMVSALRKVDIIASSHHHEVGTGGQCEIGLKHTDLLKMADNFLWYKYIVKNVAKQHGKTVTFMPKPIYADNGSGMHTHFSLWKNGNSIFSGEKYADLSQEALWAIGGVLKHAPAILAFAAPTINSYRRLVPGFESPVNLSYSDSDRSAAIRIPVYSKKPSTKRFEFRCPDPTNNGYLLFSVVLMAMVDGITNKIDPGNPLDQGLFNMSPGELIETPTVPETLNEALEALENDNDFLTKGNVFSTRLIEAYIEYKRENELNEIALRPHPYEFFLYYDC